MLRSFILFAWRNLKKNRVYSAINVLGLATGMAIAILIGLWMYDELTFDRYFDNHRTIAQVMSTTPVNGELRTSKATLLPLGLGLQGKDIQSVSMASWNENHSLQYNDVKVSGDGMFVQPSFAGMFGLKMLEGSREGLRDPSSVLLNASTAKALFGTEDPMGKTVRVSGSYDMTVAGVFEDFPENTSLTRTHLLMPWDRYIILNAHWYHNWEHQWNNHSFQAFIQLKHGADIHGLEQQLTAVVRSHPESARESILVHPMDRWRLYSEFKNGVSVGGRIQFVWMFSLIGAFILILACINFMNLSTARSEKRAREVGIRKTLGSLRVQLVVQLYIESIIVTLLALGIALCLVKLSLPFFNGLADKHMRLPLTSLSFWGSALAFTLFTGLISGTYPAIYLSSFRPIKVLKGTFKAGRLAALPRRVLVVLQFTVSVALIIGTTVVFLQVQYARDRPTGYDRGDGLIVVKLNTSGLYGHYTPLRQDLLATGAVSDMAESNGATTQVVSTMTDFRWDGLKPDAKPEFAYVAVTHDYGNTVQWQVKEGRDFSRAFSSDTGAIVLNESAVRLMGLKHPVGTVMHVQQESHTVVGVVKDMVMESPYTPVSPTIYTLDYSWTESILLRLTPGLPAQSSLDKVARVFARYNPGMPFEYKFASDEYERKFSDEKRVGQLAGVFAGLAILISCLGLFGLASFVAEQRTKEMGVRKVLGASVFHIWKLLSTEFVLLVMLSCLIATPVAWYYLDRWLSAYAYHTPISWWIFLGAAGGALVITLTTVSFQSIRAALVNPGKSLRSE
ncbi:MAG TPA: ABC transporter permease [Dinghuibacter sp.]|uniref:ABC transporter permease n=1 Tax=Dinghuibacter sp. TaxID=2024697 RepID=UPI002BD56BF6|nr:ABC transporter permease [Dinghuibacter sp.]HTJ11719.1 ABC transporter permease [Dinghuibacter sp.]